MDKKLLILLAGLLCVIALAREKMSGSLGLGSEKSGAVIPKQANDNAILSLDDPPLADYFVNDSIYSYDEVRMDWFAVEIDSDSLVDSRVFSEPIEIEWKTLMDIEYRLEFNGQVGMEIYVPVFSKAVQRLHEKEVVIKGYVIPLDEEQEFLALSYNPFASCFFCGKGSPASVISMYLKDKGKRYKVDAVARFRGTLHLNWDDPEEFYYIFRDVVEE